MAAAFVSLTSGDDSFSVTVPAGSDRLLVAIVYGSDVSTARSATYGGVAMDVANNANDWCQIFYMLDPPEGAATLAITGGTGAGTISQTIAAHYTGIGSFQGGSQASAVSASFDPDGAGLIVFGLSSESASHAPVADTNERLDDPNDWLGDRVVASAGTVTVGASAATNPDHAAAIFLEPETSANVSGTVELAAVTTAGAVADGSADISGAVTLGSVETSGSVTPVGGPMDITGDVVLGAVETSGRVAFGLVSDTGDEDIPLQSGARRFVGVVEVSAFTNQTTFKPNSVDDDALEQMPANTIKANPTAVLANAQDWAIAASRVVMRAAGNLIAGTITEVLDLLGATRGSLPLRGAATWGLLTPGTTELPLVSKGAGADPVYQRLANAGAAQMAADTIKSNITTVAANAADNTFNNVAIAQGLRQGVFVLYDEMFSFNVSYLSGSDAIGQWRWQLTDPDEGQFFGIAALASHPGIIRMLAPANGSTPVIDTGSGDSGGSDTSIDQISMADIAWLRFIVRVPNLVGSELSSASYGIGLISGSSSASVQGSTPNLGGTALALFYRPIGANWMIRDENASSGTDFDTGHVATVGQWVECILVNAGGGSWTVITNGVTRGTATGVATSGMVYPAAWIHNGDGSGADKNFDIDRFEIGVLPAGNRFG